MAIGAGRSDILALILRQAAIFTGIGVIAGLAAAIPSARLIDSLLFHTSVADPLSVSISIAALLLVTLVAVIIPAARAASVNPVEALRSE
jgi:ABC-type antimicrobial peptide transport system permease subunit